MRKLLALTVGALALASLAAAMPDRPAWSQGARTIRVVLTVPPGGSIDLLFRILADQIGGTKGQTFVIESRPGAGGVIAAEAVARSAPDGNTLLSNNNGTIISSILRKVNYDPLTSFEPICYLVTTPQLVVVNSASPYRTLAELIDAARAKPGELSIASVGPNTTQHIGIERLKRLAKADLTYVSFPGGAPTVNALLGAHVTSAVLNWSEVGEQVDRWKGPSARDHGIASHRAPAGSADGVGIRLQGFRDGRVVRRGGAGEDAEGDGVATHRLVQDRSRCSGRQGEARRPGALPQTEMRRRFRRSPPAPVRAVHAINPRTEFKTQ